MRDLHSNVLLFTLDMTLYGVIQYLKMVKEIT